MKLNNNVATTLMIYIFFVSIDLSAAQSPNYDQFKKEHADKQKGMIEKYNNNPLFPGNSQQLIVDLDVLKRIPKQYSLINLEVIPTLEERIKLKSNISLLNMSAQVNHLGSALQNIIAIAPRAGYCDTYDKGLLSTIANSQPFRDAYIAKGWECRSQISGDIKDRFIQACKNIQKIIPQFPLPEDALTPEELNHKKQIVLALVEKFDPTPKKSIWGSLFSDATEPSTMAELNQNIQTIQEITQAMHCNKINLSDEEQEQIRLLTQNVSSRISLKNIINQCNDAANNHEKTYTSEELISFAQQINKLPTLMEFLDADDIKTLEIISQNEQFIALIQEISKSLDLRKKEKFAQNCTKIRETIGNFPLVEVSESLTPEQQKANKEPLLTANTTTPLPPASATAPQASISPVTPAGASHAQNNTTEQSIAQDFIAQTIPQSIEPQKSKKTPLQVAPISEEQFNSLLNPLLYRNFPNKESIICLENLIDALTQRDYSFSAKRLENIYVVSKVYNNLTDQKKLELQTTIIDICTKLRPQPTWTWRNPTSWVNATKSWFQTKISNFSRWLWGY